MSQPIDSTSKGHESLYLKCKSRLSNYEKLQLEKDSGSSGEIRLKKKIERLKHKIAKLEYILESSKPSELMKNNSSSTSRNQLSKVDEKKQKKRKRKEKVETIDDTNREDVFDAMDTATDGGGQDKVEDDKKAEDQIAGNVESGNAATVPLADSGKEPAWNERFVSLGLSDETMAGVTRLHFDTMTPIQLRAIPYALSGNDVMACAKTGSGKTLAFLIPALELLHSFHYQPCMGTGVIIITPTKELALQIYGVLEILAGSHQFSYGLAIGGRNRSREAKELVSGINILVATPGRLLDHLQNTEHFFKDRLKCLILDEADRILDIGFEKEMRIILQLLPSRRQTMFFSATLGKKTKALSKKAIKKDYAHVEADALPPKRLKQYIIVCDPKRRLDVLFSFLRRIMKHKSMVFMSSCKAVQYYQSVFEFAEFPIFSIHGHQKLSTRSSTFYSYREAKEGILLCTDVAARGLDIPAVDWIIQYDPPVDPTEYIHRVGRTARAGASGEALLFLRPHEVGFLSVMKQMGIETVEFDIAWSEVTSVQPLLTSLVKATEVYERLAREAYESYVRSYAAYILKDHFNVDRLELTAVANSFGLEDVPLSDMKVYSSKKNRARHDFKRKLHVKRQ